MVFLVQFLVTNVSAYTEPATYISSPYFRSASVIMLTSSVGTNNFTANVIFPVVFAQAPRVAFALKRYKGKFRLMYRKG